MATESATQGWMVELFKRNDIAIGSVAPSIRHMRDQQSLRKADDSAMKADSEVVGFVRT